jgi:acylaminoacyl-peptidase
VGKTEWVDDSKVGITGGSYGGYMTNWVVGHTNAFSAAVACRSISNMYSKYGVADNGWSGNKEGFGGRDLWDSEDFIMERSPIRYAPNVKTPLLLFHSEQDYRCPIEQAEQFYVALKRLGKTVEFVRCAGENHELSRSGKPWNRVERLDTIVRWFERFMK